jgi:hypothetical protein
MMAWGTEQETEKGETGRRIFGSSSGRPWNGGFWSGSVIDKRQFDR